MSRVDTAPLDREARGCFDFFWNECNTDTSSAGYGLIADTDTAQSPCSIASVGFGLTALAIGADRGWVGKPEAGERASAALTTLLTRAARVHGFLHHFVDMRTVERVWTCEVSVIDTAILVAGALTAGEYFGPPVSDRAAELYEDVDWPWYRDPDTDQFRMGWWPERGFDGYWSFADEQLMLYVLGAGSPAHPAPGSMLTAFTRSAGSYADGRPFVHSTFGSIFTYQFSHAWVDFRRLTDPLGVNWFENSVAASIASHAYCRDNPEGFETFSGLSWGPTACNGPGGYSGMYGALPSGRPGVPPFRNDGTIPPCGAAGSLVFTPDLSLAALTHYASDPRLAGRYGLVDAYNLDHRPAWYDTRVIGIDKGITLLMIENHRSGLVWELFNRAACVRAGLEACGLRPTRDPTSR